MRHVHAPYCLDERFPPRPSSTPPSVRPSSPFPPARPKPVVAPAPPVTVRVTSWPWIELAGLPLALTLAPLLLALAAREMSLLVVGVVAAIAAASSAVVAWPASTGGHRDRLESARGRLRP